jgi:hypothetical protein
MLFADFLDVVSTSMLVQDGYSTIALVCLKAIEMLAAHCLFGGPYPIQSALAGRKMK